MNYQRIYDSLITRARTRHLTEFTERHHVTPRCMGGNDSKSNLVDLTPEEHFIAHQLLVKIYPANDKLVYAARWMSNRVVNNKEYGWIKRKYRDVVAGKARSVESVQKQRATVAAKVAAGDWHSTNLGKHLTDEHKAALSNAHSGKEIPVKSRTSLEGYIMRYGEEEGLRLWNLKRAETSERKKGVKLRAKTTEERDRLRTVALSRPKIKCPHCDKQGQAGLMHRWHFDNCKRKN